jgi:hypothetical protein
MAEERSEHCRSDSGELRHGGYGHLRQRLDVWSRSEQLSWLSDERGSDADGECCGGGADDYYAACESDGDGRTNGRLHSCGDRYGTAELSMAEERSERRRGYSGELHHGGYGHLRQRIDVWSRSEQLSWVGDERGSDADGECCTGAADDYYAACESDSDGRTDGRLHGCGDRYGTAELSMAEERSEHCRSDSGELHHADYDNVR